MNENNNRVCIRLLNQTLLDKDWWNRAEEPWREEPPFTEWPAAGERPTPVEQRIIRPETKWGVSPRDPI